MTLFASQISSASNTNLRGSGQENSSRGTRADQWDQQWQQSLLLTKIRVHRQSSETKFTFPAATLQPSDTYNDKGPENGKSTSRLF